MSARIILPWLAAFALLLQAILPSGFMPDFSGGTGLHIMICDGHMPAMPGMPGVPAPQPDHHKAPPCPYAMAALLSFVAVSILLLPILPKAARIRFVFKPATLRRWPCGHVSSRGPPVLFKKI